MNFDPTTITITLYALVTDRHIAAIKWLRALAPIAGYGSHVQLGLKNAKLVADRLRDGEAIFTFTVDEKVAPYVRDSAKLHGFVLDRPETVIMSMDSVITLKPEYADDIPF